MRSKFTLVLLTFLLSGCDIVQDVLYPEKKSSDESSVFVSSENIVSSVEQINSFSELSSSEALSSESIASSTVSSVEQISSESVSSMPSSSSEEQENNILKFDFYNINDFHGSIEETASLNEIGLAKMATYLKQEKAKNEAGFVLTSSGDMWQGSALSNTFKGAIVNDWMNFIGFDCMTLGNHEFDWGIDLIKSNMQQMNFPVISCNIENKELAKPVDWISGTAMKTINGVNVGFVGAIGEGQTSDIIASTSHNLNFPDPSNYAINAAKSLRDSGAEIIVYLLHDSVDTISRNVAMSMDLVFCGHTHTGEKEMLYNLVPAVQAYSNGKDLAHISLTYDKVNKKVTYNTYEIVDLRYINVQEDALAKELIEARITPEVDAKLNRVVAKTTRTISRSTQVSLLTKYLYDYYKDNIDEFPIFATNYNNSRSDISRGDITYKDVFKAFPFDNQLCVMKIKGSALNTISYGTFYYPGSKTIDVNQYYYIFTIDYIAEYDYYFQPELGVEIVRKYSDLYPRDIFAEYLKQDYPL